MLYDSLSSEVQLHLPTMFLLYLRGTLSPTTSAICTKSSKDVMPRKRTILGELSEELCPILSAFYTLGWEYTY